MVNRAAHEMGLGKYPEVTLAEARRLKAHGKDPLEERKALRATSKADAAKRMTFARDFPWIPIRGCCRAAWQGSLPALPAMCGVVAAHVI
ncbi:MAG: hypothetical protein JWM91_3356 [Rhodospirillales bacterium]|nr:hypothetical protein [Rhodospirillales bacterium]